MSSSGCKSLVVFCQGIWLCLLSLSVIVWHIPHLYLMFSGAVALENIHPFSKHRFINAEVSCTGLESNITNCIQDLDEAYSCLSFGIASVTCHSKITSRFCRFSILLWNCALLIFCSWYPSQCILHWWCNATPQWLSPRRRKGGDLYQQCLGHCLW